MFVLILAHIASDGWLLAM